MPDGFNVQTDRLLRGAGGFGSSGDALTQAGTTLGSALDAQGECWGGDESGQAFAKDYVPNSQKVRDAFGSLAEALHAIRTALEESANSYDNVETQSTDGYRAMEG
ncbi:WXG100 family type VII secretion target [Actinophytocola glycyrrhizae]|uniref:WXG100 family type VII secretion target n=1 Tax=Actinophytocola glycyrrhizae TaxID=2044873 RepID=A0ABV9RTD1_9PSEU